MPPAQAQRLRQSICLISRSFLLAMSSTVRLKCKKRTMLRHALEQEPGGKLFTVGRVLLKIAEQALKFDPLQWLRIGVAERLEAVGHAGCAGAKIVIVATLEQVVFDKLVESLLNTPHVAADAGGELGCGGG